MQQQAGRKDMERPFQAQNPHVGRKLQEVNLNEFDHATMVV